MIGSRLVQSPFNATTPCRANADLTDDDRSATRSFTRHVMHHAAVKLTKTGVPAARSSASRLGVNGSQPAPSAGVDRDAVNDPATGPSATALATSATVVTTAARRQ